MCMIKKRWNNWEKVQMRQKIGCALVVMSKVDERKEKRNALKTLSIAMYSAAAKDSMFFSTSNARLCQTAYPALLETISVVKIMSSTRRIYCWHTLARKRNRFTLMQIC